MLISRDQDKYVPLFARRIPEYKLDMVPQDTNVPSRRLKEDRS